jgi:hypothetical protein
MAAQTYVHGRISNVTFEQDSVMIMIDAGLPDNCAGTSWRWMRVPAEYKPMVAS